MPLPPSAQPSPAACDDARFAEFLHRDSKSAPPGSPLSPAILPTSAYYLPGEPQGPYQYARWSHPGWTELERSLGLLEEAKCAIFPSGLAAIAALFAATLRPGGRVLLQSDGYAGTRATAQQLLPGQGIDVRSCPTAQLGAADVQGVDLVLVETPSNPGLDLVDIGALAQRVHAAGGRLAVDNTLMTPLAQQPLDLGADASVYSDTKVLNGHSDAVFGHLCTRQDGLLDAAVDWRRASGAVPGPFETWLVQRGVETLDVRLARMQENALELARALERALGPAALRYPGLASHPQHELGARQMRGSGCLIGLTLPSAAAAERFIEHCRYLRPCTSFGGVHSSAERRARWGDAVPEGFLRISVGCEPTGALRAELLRALAAALG